MGKTRRLVVLSGPSCVGKGPLCSALETFYPRLMESMHKLVLYNSRQPRPGEQEGVDYCFRAREEITQMSRTGNFVLLEIRGDLQGLNLDELRTRVDQGEAVLFEGNPFIPEVIFDHPYMADIDMVKVFLSPLSREDILWLKSRGADLYEVLTDIMRRKLLRRTQRQKGLLSAKDLENIEKRAGSAPLELQYAVQYDWVIANHDGEDSDNWQAFYYPLGDALRSLHLFAAILKGDIPAGAEQWEEGLWPTRRRFQNTEQI